jgi:DNA processing protein
MFNSSSSLYLHAFNLLPQFGPTRLQKICDFFESPEQAFSASEQHLLQAGIESEIVKKFLAHRTTLHLEQEAEKLNREGITLLNYKDDNYPELLLQIPKFPPLLYYKGRMENADELCVAVVGTRKITTYGRTVAPFLIEPLIQSKVTIVSGLAYGVDSQMQQLSIKNRRRTIAVLGGGLDDKSFYPKEHLLLAQNILENGGALVSEYPIGTPPLKHHFIARNRIISGLSVATVIIECNLKSGSLITAKYALDQNRTVYAVPGPIYSEMSTGPNNLIKMGAKLVTHASDILDDLNIKTLPDQQEAQQFFGDNPTETKILQQLTFEPITVNELIKAAGLEASEATSALTFLEMKGKIKNLGAQQYIRSR